jgi:hypothetical protein
MQTSLKGKSFGSSYWNLGRTLPPANQIRNWLKLRRDLTVKLTWFDKAVWVRIDDLIVAERMLTSASESPNRCVERPRDFEALTLHVHAGCGVWTEELTSTRDRLKRIAACNASEARRGTLLRLARRASRHIWLVLVVLRLLRLFEITLRNNAIGAFLLQLLNLVLKTRVERSAAHLLLQLIIACKEVDVRLGR